jgi:hypothetical protein
MRVPWACLLAVGLVFTGCGKKEAPAKPKDATNTTATAPAGSNPLNAPADYLGGLSQAKRLAEKVVDATSLNQTIQLFYQEEDRYPTNLAELVTKKYYPALPRAPYGHKFLYDPRTGQVRVVKEQPGQ